MSALRSTADCSVAGSDPTLEAEAVWKQMGPPIDFMVAYIEV